jgi:tetratricopeptide (TPR) repeat protein
MALELAYRMMAEYSPLLVLWIPAISRETFEIAYREIGSMLRIPGITDDNVDVKQLVKNSLNSGGFGDWLMVIDNADDPGVLLDSTNDDPRAGRLYDYLPRSDRGSILFTTRSRKVAERLTQSSVLELKDMSKAEAKQLMARRISDKALLDEEDAVSELLELLTYLPLAIVQAAAFINSNQLSMSDYVSLFNHADTTKELFSERFEDPSRYRETESTIARTWHISFRQILNQDPLAARYLFFIACIDRINIPQSLLPIEGTAVQRLKAVGTLTGYSFMAERQRSPQQLEGERFFDIHRLVQKATIWWLKEHSEWTAWVEAAYGRLEELLPRGHEGIPKWISYVPHAIHVADLHSALNETGGDSLLHRIGRCQAMLGQYAAAEETFRRVLSLRRMNMGNEDVSTLDSMNDLAIVLQCLGKYEEAEIMIRQALVILEKTFGPKHLDTLVGMKITGTLASSLQINGKYKDAESINRQTLARQEKVLGHEHQDTLNSMNNLANSLSKQGKREEAELMYRQTMARREKVLGPAHPDTLTSMNNLVVVLCWQGKHGEAESMSRLTLARQEKVLGPAHPDTLRSMNNLAMVLRRQGKSEEAESIYRQTIAQKGKVLGHEHPSTLGSMSNLAIVLSSQGKHKEAESIFSHTITRKEKVLGPEHPETLGSVHNLAMVLRRQGKLDEAELMHRQTLAREEKRLGPAHPDTLASVLAIAQLLTIRRRYDEAAPLYERACAGRSSVLGHDHPATCNSRQAYSKMLALQEQDRLRSAETKETT